MIPSSFPLQWPETWPRTPETFRTAGPNQMPAGRIRQQLNYELEKFGAKDVVISSNLSLRRDGLPYAGQGEPDDPAIAVYFTRKGEPNVIACDRFRTYDANLRGIGISVESLRRIDRYGSPQVAERAVNYRQLPASVIVTPYTRRPWHEVLEVSPTASREVIRAAFKQMALKHHPDHGGSSAAFQEVQDAYGESGASS